MRTILPLLGFALVLLVAYAPAEITPADHITSADTTWSWPVEAENLHVLPENTGPDELRRTMFGFTRALGVRCWFCHVGEEGMDFSEFDFVSDDNGRKVAAREMMRLVAEINDDISEIPGLRPAEGPRVTCYTCHQGSNSPATHPPRREWSPPSNDNEEDDHEGHDHDGHDHGEDD